MFKNLIYAPLLIAAISLSSQESKAEGGCPNGLYPVGGGYCRDIVCRMTSQSTSWTVGYGQVTPNGTRCNAQSCRGFGSTGTGVAYDPQATSTLAKYKQECPSGVANWGNLIVPKAR